MRRGCSRATALAAGALFSGLPNCNDKENRLDLRSKLGQYHPSRLVLTHAAQPSRSKATQVQGRRLGSFGSFAGLKGLALTIADTFRGACVDTRAPAPDGQCGRISTVNRRNPCDGSFLLRPGFPRGTAPRRRWKNRELLATHRGQPQSRCYYADGSMFFFNFSAIAAFSPYSVCSVFLRLNS